VSVEPETDIIPQPLPPGDAYALLSKPTAALSEDEIKLICQDLRHRRIKFLEGKADKPERRAAAKPKATPEEKAAATEQLRIGLLGSLEI
jgi:hypothetical protein